MAVLDAPFGAAFRINADLAVVRSRFATVHAEDLNPIAWRELAARSVGDNAFFGAAFAAPAIAALGTGARVATVTAANGKLVAAMPFASARLGRIAPAARAFSHDYGPLGLPLMSGDIESAAAILIDGLAAGRSLILPDMPVESRIAAAFSRAAATAGRPVAIVGRHVRAAYDIAADSIADARAALPGRRRKEYGRLMRRLSETGKVETRIAVSPHDVARDFERFLTLEAAGWKGRHGTAMASSAAVATFARAAVRNSAKHGAVRIVSLTLDGEALAMVVVFTAGATAFTWKIAYDERFARFSPGAQLMLDLPRHLADVDGMAVVDSLASPDHPMIDHLWPGRIPLATIVIGPPGGGALWRAGLAAAEAEADLRTRVRRLLRR